MEWPAKRCYVGLVTVGVQEQAEDILVPLLLRNCLTLNYISFPSHYLPPRTVVLAIVFYCLGHCMMMMMMMMRQHLRNALFYALRQLSGTHYRKLFSVVTLLQFLSLG